MLEFIIGAVIVIVLLQVIDYVLWAIAIALWLCVLFTSPAMGILIAWVFYVLKS